MSADEDLKGSDRISVSRDHGNELWRPEIVEAIFALLYQDDFSLDRFVTDVQELEEREGLITYIELLYLLTHLRFEADEAKGHWEAVIQHREDLGKAIGSPVELSVALVSYFVQVSHKLQHAKVIELKLFEETRASAYKDDLTGLYNFRFFQEYLGWEVKRCERHGGEFSIAMADIDNFKDYNDQFGHDVGNEALRVVGQGLEEVGREQDVAVRYGGEEFVLIMPATSKEDAGHVADRVCRRIAELELNASDPTRGVTISLGVASYPADALTADDLIRCADRAMYIAKARGKNQVQLYGANRRAHRRVHVAVEGRLRTMKDESVPFSTLDISERGLRFESKEPISVDSIVEFVLTLPGHSQDVKAYGRVVRIDEVTDGHHVLVLSIVDIDNREYLALTRYLHSQSLVAEPAFEPD